MQLIIEGAILQEATIVKTLPTKAVFRLIMQTVNEANRNRRLYPMKVLNDALLSIDDKIKRRSFFGELDHPPTSGDLNRDMRRQTTVYLERICQVLRTYEFQGNNLFGEMETTTNDKGQNLFALLRDRAGIGISGRSIGQLRFDEHQKINMVEGPLQLISYDAVSAPSHQAALVDFSRVNYENLQIIQENAGIVTCADGQCMTTNYYEKNVDKLLKKYLKRWV